MKIPNLRFERQHEHTAAVNLSFSIFTSTALLPVHLQRALSAIKDAREKQSQNGRHFPNVYFQMTLSLPLLLPSLLLKVPIFEVFTTTQARGIKSFILFLCMKTIRAKQAKVLFAYFVPRGQLGIIADHLT